jgi:hypothetical protein
MTFCRDMIVVAILLVPLRAESAEQPTLRWQEPWCAVFGGEKSVMHFSISSEAPTSYRADWRLSINDRTLARHEATVGTVANRPQIQDVDIEIPEVRPDAIVSSDLTVTLSTIDDTTELASRTKRLWIFPRHPFAGRRQWLESLDITLFDPLGDTARRFTEVEICFRQIDNLDTALDIKRGIFIVGEGLSFDDYRGLPEIMVRLAQRQIGVLCLAPSAGAVRLLSDDEYKGMRLERLVLEREVIITKLDKRLDATAWPGGQPVVAHRVSLTSTPTSTTAEVSDQLNSWPWLDVSYTSNSGRLVMCGFAIIAGWQSGPTPAYLLRRIFEDLADDKAVAAIPERQLKQGDPLP